VPVIVEPAGKSYPVFESSAILLYLAEKTGKPLPKEIMAKFNAIQWLMTRMSTVGPMFGQHVHFLRVAPSGTSAPEAATGPRRTASRRSSSTALLDQPTSPGWSIQSPTSPLSPAAQCPGSAGCRGNCELAQRHRLGEGDRRTSGGEKSACRVDAVRALTGAFDKALPNDLDKVFGRGQFAAA
jgi:GST-like protein